MSLDYAQTLAEVALVGWGVNLAMRRYGFAGEVASAWGTHVGWILSQVDTCPLDQPAIFNSGPVEVFWRAEEFGDRFVFCLPEGGAPGTAGRVIDASGLLEMIRTALAELGPEEFDTAEKVKGLMKHLGIGLLGPQGIILLFGEPQGRA